MCTYKHSMSFPQIIAVTNRSLCRRPFTEQIERICAHQPKGIILREKDLNEDEYMLLAEKVLNITRKYRVPCTLHTYIRTARILNCPGIHLPLPLLRKYAGQIQPPDTHNPQIQQPDTRNLHIQPPGRDSLGYFTEIGCSIHHLDEAKEAVSLGATYLTAGHIYSTDCKKDVPPRGLPFLREICQSVPVPVYAIGGIRLTPDSRQLQEIQNCGAAGGCVMSGMMRL